MMVNEFEMTEEKVLKLKPIIERILSRKYGKEITFKNLTVGMVMVESKDAQTLENALEKILKEIIESDWSKYFEVIEQAE